MVREEHEPHTKGEEAARLRDEIDQEFHMSAGQLSKKNASGVCGGSIRNSRDCRTTRHSKTRFEPTFVAASKN
jgi:hypothetical protein